MNLVSVSDISSLNFRTDWKLPFQQNVDFVSQFLPSDPMQVQYITLDSSINVYLENHSTGEIKQLYPTLLEEGLDYKYYNLSINNSQVVTDTCFTLFFATAPDDAPILSSEFEVCMELPGTVLLKYTNRRDEKGAIFSGVDPFYFRVNAVFLPQENSFESEAEDFRDQRFNKKILSSHSYEKKTLTIGPSFGVPNWVGRKINIIFSLSSVWVDGNFMVSSGEGSVSINVLGNDYPRYIYKIVLEDSEEEIVEEEASEIQFARAVDEKKKIIRKASELDIRVYSDSYGGSVYADNALMIRELDFIQELSENYLIEVDDNVSGSTKKATFTALVKLITPKFVSKEADKELINNWNTAYGWGDHAQAGYISKVADKTQISNWDTAYSWGDHSKAGYLKAKDFNDLFELVTVGNSQVIKAKYSLFSVAELSAYGFGESGGGGGAGVDIIDNLDSTLTNAALSANMGRYLKTLIDGKASDWASITGKPNLAILNFYGNYWGLPSNETGANTGYIRTPAAGLIPNDMNAAGSGSVGTPIWPFLDMHAKTFYGTLSGNASTASKWATARTVTFSGDLTGAFSIDGSANVTSSVNIAGIGNIATDWQANFRKYLYGSTAYGSFLKTFRSDIASTGLSVYGASLGWGISDTQAYLNVGYSANEAYIGGGNAGIIKWYKKLAFEDTMQSWADGRFLKLSGGKITGILNVQPQARIGFYNEGIRIGSYNGGWSNIQFGADANKTEGAIEGQWVVGKNTSHDFVISYAGLQYDAGVGAGISIAKSNAGLYFNGNTVWHAGNDGYGSGLDADLLDGYRRSDLYQGIDAWMNATTGLSATIDLSASTYDQNTFYPVTGTAIRGDGMQFIKVAVHLNSGTKPTWSIHVSGFTAIMELWATASGWGTTFASSYIVQYEYRYADKNPVGYTQMTNSSTPVLWLRGGGRYYIKTGYNCGWTIHTAAITIQQQTVQPQSGGTAPFSFVKTTLYANLSADNIYSAGLIKSDLGFKSRNICIECENDGTAGSRIYEINNFASALCLQHATSNSLYLCNGGGNVGIGNTAASWKLHVTGDIYSTGWVRTEGAHGWYNHTYGGGMYMTDSKWLRTYGNKSLCIDSAYGTATGCNGFGVGLAIRDPGASSIEIQGGNYVYGIGSHGNGSMYWWRGVNSTIYSSANKSYMMVYNGSTWAFTGNITATGEIAAYSASDYRLKTNLTEIKGRASNMLRLLRPVEFEWNDEAIALNPNRHKHDISFIAQEYEKVFPFAIGTIYEKYMSIDKQVLFSVLTAGWQEHDDEITRLKRKVSELEKEVEQLKAA